MDNSWQAITALGNLHPVTVEIGPYRITERFDVALASLAMRMGQGPGFAAAAGAAKMPLPLPARHQTGPEFSAFWVAADQWFIEVDYAIHPDIVARLKPTFGPSASITEQSDAWVRFDVSGAGLAALFARLCNLDLPALPDGYASRTVIEHLGVYLIRHGAQAVTIYGPRSSAQSLLHAVTVAAKSVV